MHARRIGMLMGVVVLAPTPAWAQWQTDPAFGARPNAYGDGHPADGTGRPLGSVWLGEDDDDE